MLNLFSLKNETALRGEGCLKFGYFLTGLIG